MSESIFAGPHITTDNATSRDRCNSDLMSPLLLVKFENHVGAARPLEDERDARRRALLAHSGIYDRPHNRQLVAWIVLWSENVIL